MVVMDASTLLLLFDPQAKPPKDETTGQPLEKCKERIDLLVQDLSEQKTVILIPTPALSEILIVSKTDTDRAQIIAAISKSRVFRVQPFDEAAAIEVAKLTDVDIQSNRELSPVETKAKIKYDRQIIAIAKVNGVKIIYSDDTALCKKAFANGITAIKTSELPFPQEPPQLELQLIGKENDTG